MMTGKFPRRSLASASLLICAILVNGMPVAAQDVVTSEDFTGGSSAFVFRSRQRPAPRRTAVRAVQSIARTQKAKLDTLKRVTTQTITVAKTLTKRQVSKEVDPTTVQVDAIRRKSPQEASVVFAGVGEYYLGEDNLEEAVRWFREAASLDAKNLKAKAGLSDALTRKAEALLAQENYDIAKMFFDEAQVNNPKNAGAVAGLAEIASAKNDQETAIKKYESAVTLDPDLTELNAPLGVLYFQKGEIAKAEIYLQRALAGSQDNPETQFFFGLLRYKQGRYAEAADALRKSIALDNTNADAYYYLGEVMNQLDKSNDAIAAYENAVRINPRMSDAWADLGAAYFNADKPAKAVDAYKAAIKANARFGEAYANLAEVYRHLGDWDAAISNYRMALNFVTADKELYSNYGYVAIRRAVAPGYSGFWQIAIDNFEKAAAIKPDYIDYTNIGWAYYNLAQVKRNTESEYKANLLKAKDNFVKANSLNPPPKVAAATNLNLGLTLNELGEFKGAIAALTAVQEVRKDWVAAANELGIAYRKDGDFENAIKQFKRAIDLNDKLPGPHYNLAEAYYRSGKPAEAKKEYEKLKSRGDDYYVKLLITVTNGGILR